MGSIYYIAYKKYLAHVNIFIMILMIFHSNLLYSKEKNIPKFTIISEEWKPFNFQGNNKLLGISVELLDKIFEEMNIKQKASEGKIYPWIRGYNMALENSNTILFTTTKTDERENKFKWLGPIFINKTELFAIKNRRIFISNINDMRKYIISTYRDGAPEKLLLELGILEDELDRLNHQNLALRKLFYGRSDLVPTSKLSISYFAEAEKLDIDFVESVYEIASRGMYYAFSLDVSNELIEEMQIILNNLHKIGFVSSLFDKYGVSWAYEI